MATTKNGTYYPGDYNSKADVPEDMKKMADSIDANKVQKIKGKGLSTNDFTNEYKQKLDGLENYDDTEIKKDISDIKEEQATQNKNIENLQKNDTTQDELIEKLQQENKNIKSALINVETEKSKSIHIENASTVSAKLEVEGNAEQEVREGYNLLDMRDAKGGTSNGITVTINEDGSYKYVGTATSKAINVWLKGGYSNTNPLFTLEAGKKYFIKDVLLYNLQNQITTEETITLSSNIDVTGVRAPDATVGNTYNETYYPMLTENEEKPWEQYGASPSSNYPSEIICLGSNKNEFDMSNIENGGYTRGVVGAELSKSSNSTRVRLNNLIVAKKNTQYSFSMKTDKALRYNILEVGEDNIIKRITSVSDTRSTTITTTEETAYITFLFLWQTTTQNITTDDLEDCLIKLEEGTATSYSPYGQGSTEIKKINKNLYNPVTNSSERYGIKYIIDEKGVVTLNGTATQQTDIYIISPDLNNQITRVQGKIVSLKANNSDFSLYGKVTGGRYIKDSKILLSDTENEITNSFIRIPANTVCNNLKVYPQIEIGEETDYKEHQEESYVLPIQQEMLQGDCFIKEDDGWKEVHDWEKYIFTGNETLKSAVQNNIIQFNYEKNFIDRVSICNYLKNTTIWWKENTIIIGTALNAIYFQCSVTDFPDIPTFQNWLTEKYNSKNPLIIYYKLATPTKLACTEGQSTVLDKLNELDLFGGTNNIITTEDIALLKLKYVVDTKTYVDNKYNQLANQILEIAGGN